MLIVNQEMVVRLGAVTGVGHARLIHERFGRFWGAFSVGRPVPAELLDHRHRIHRHQPGADYLGVSKYIVVADRGGADDPSWPAPAASAAWNGYVRVPRFVSLLLMPMLLMAHPPVGDIGRRSSWSPRVPGGRRAPMMLLIIAIVGTTVAPWQLFFQQSNVVDKRITPRFIAYERADPVIGSFVVMVGGIALMAFTAGAPSGNAGFGNFTDAGGIAAGLARHVGRSQAYCSRWR